LTRLGINEFEDLASMLPNDIEDLEVECAETEDQAHSLMPMTRGSKRKVLLLVKWMTVKKQESCDLLTKEEWKALTLDDFNDYRANIDPFSPIFNTPSPSKRPAASTQPKVANSIDNNVINTILPVPSINNIVINNTITKVNDNNNFELVNKQVSMLDSNNGNKEDKQDDLLLSLSLTKSMTSFEGKDDKYKEDVVFNKTNIVYTTYSSSNQRVFYGLGALEGWGEICGFSGGKFEVQDGLNYSALINGELDHTLSTFVGYPKYWPILRCLLFWGVNADTIPDEDNNTRDNMKKQQDNAYTFKMVGSDTMT